MLHAIPNSSAMDTAEIFAWLTEPRRDRKPTQDATWSIAGIAREFGTKVAEGIYSAMVRAELHGLAARFASVGLDAGDPQWAAQVDALAAVNPDLASLAPVIRDLGYDTRPMWERLGLPEAPTVETIEQWQAEAERDYTYRQVLLSANRNPDGLGLVIRVMPCDNTGRVKPGDAGTTSMLRARQGTVAESALFDSVQSAIESYLAAIGR